MKPSKALFSPSPKKRIYPEKTSYISGNRNPEKTFYIFSKESFSYTSGEGNPTEIPYISGNGTFASFLRKSVKL